MNETELTLIRQKYLTELNLIYNINETEFNKINEFYLIKKKEIINIKNMVDNIKDENDIYKFLYYVKKSQLKFNR